MANLKVTVFYGEMGLGMAADGVAELQTDAKGCFSMPLGKRDPETILKIKSGKIEINYAVAVKHASLVQINPISFRYEVGKDYGNLQVLVIEGAAIEGRAYDKNTGKGIEGVAIKISSSDWPTTTNAQGHYRFEGLREGKYILERRRVPGYVDMAMSERKEVVIGLGQEIKEIDFPLRPSLSVSGKVVDSEGRPLPYILLRFRLANRPFVEARSDRDGRFAAEGFSTEDIFWIEPLSADWAASSAEKQRVPEGGLKNLTVTLAPAASAEGQVVDKAGKPIANASVRWTRLEGEERETGPPVTTDSKGNFRFTGLRAGVYEFDAQPDGLRSNRQRQKNPTTLTLRNGEKKEGIRLILDTDMTTRGGLTPEGAAIASPHPKWPNELPSGSHGPFQPTPVDLVKGRVIRADTGKPVTTFRFALRGRTVFDLLHPNPQDSNPSADTEIYLQEVNHADGVFEAKAWSSGRHTPYIRARGLAEESIVFSVLQKEAFFHRGIYDSISMLHAS